MSPGELKCVIAHECGHIHNRHAVYKTIIRVLLDSSGGFVSAANTILMQLWTRAGEITADRAAMICADSIEDAIRVNKKFLKDLLTVDVEGWKRELETIGASYDEYDAKASKDAKTTSKTAKRVPKALRQVLCDVAAALKK
jgi:hypothetical protein